MELNNHLIRLRRDARHNPDCPSYLFVSANAQRRISAYMPCDPGCLSSAIAMHRKPGVGS